MPGLSGSGVVGYVRTRSRRSWRISRAERAHPAPRFPMQQPWDRKTHRWWRRTARLAFTDERLPSVRRRYAEDTRLSMPDPVQLNHAPAEPQAEPMDQAPLTIGVLHLGFTGTRRPPIRQDHCRRAPPLCRSFCDRTPARSKASWSGAAWWMPCGRCAASLEPMWWSCRIAETAYGDRDVPSWHSSSVVLSRDPGARGRRVSRPL